MRRLYLLALLVLVSYQSFGQNLEAQPTVDFIRCTADIELKHSDKDSGRAAWAYGIVEATVRYDFRVSEKTSSIYLDFQTAPDNWTKQKLPAESTMNFADKRFVLNGSFQPGEEYSWSFDYTASPRRTLYFIDKDLDGSWEQAWTQGQGKYTSYWLPSIDNVNDKIEFDLTVMAPEGMEIIANGELKDRKTGKINSARYDMQQPMSSYLVALAVGDFTKTEEKSASGIPIELYIQPEHRQMAEPTYRHTVKVFDFLEQEIGVPYPWSNYKQVPVSDFLYAGMENTTATIFSDRFVTDSIGSHDVSFLTVNAHEMAHQWFGDYVTASSGKHHWLQEGFATYYALLAEREIRGDDWYYMQLYENTKLLLERDASGQSTALLDENAGSLTFYQHGAWALHALRDLVGDSRFRESVKTYLEENAYGSVTTDDFLKTVEKTSGMDLDTFKKTWLTANNFPAPEAIELLKKSLFMNRFFQVAALQEQPFYTVVEEYDDLIQKTENSFLLEEVASHLLRENDSTSWKLLKKLAKKDDLQVRQRIVMGLRMIPDGMEDVIASMLLDASYLTRENALYLLWINSNREEKWLTKSYDLWQNTTPALEITRYALQLNTDSYTLLEANGFLDKLQQYTSARHTTDDRLLAFQMLMNLGGMNRQTYTDLIHACTHFNYRFYKPARELLKTAYSKPTERAVIDGALFELGKQKKDRIKKILAK